MILALIIALPFMGALLPLLAERGGRTLCAASAGVAPLIGLVLLLGQRGTVFAGQTLTASYSWLPEIGINLSLRLDGLGFLFALLILGIGLLDPLRPLLPLRTGADGAFLRFPAAVHGL